MPRSYGIVEEFTDESALRDNQRSMIGATFDHTLLTTYLATLFPTGTRRPVTVRVAPYPWVLDPALTGAEDILAEDLDVRRWFPLGALSVRFDHLPGTDFELRNNLRIYVSARRAKSLPNDSIRIHLGQEWHGNVLVVTHGRKRPNGIIHGRIAAKTLTDALISQYVPNPCLARSLNTCLEW